MLEKKKIVFLLKNGIGFGHFKLALTIAKHFDRNKYEILFITQAKSTRIFNGYHYKVFNLPMMHLLKHNNEVLLFNNLVNDLLNHIKPDLVIEDTYPDNFYLNLTALVHVPRILIINRLVASEFEELYFEGVLGRYDKLIILKDKKDFVSSFFTDEVKNFVNYSDRIAYYGNVFNYPTAEQRELVRVKYHFNDFQKTIVVNCGAGGWHIGENVCKTIFEQVISVSNNIIDHEHNYQFIFVLGPYSAYIKEELNKQVYHSENVVFVDFEDYSDALFQECDLVILRPGYNSTMEAISGSAQVILLPGISYMEEQDVWCQELKELYGIDYVNVNSLELLESKITEKLTMGRAKKRSIKNNTENVMQVITQVIDENVIDRVSRPIMICFNLDECLSEHVKKIVSDWIYEYDMAIFQSECNNNKDQIMDSQNKITVINITDNMITPNDHYLVSAIYLDEKLNYRQVEFYQKRYHYKDNGTILLNLVEVIIEGDKFSRKKFLHAIMSSDRYADGVVLKICCDTKNESEVLNFINTLKDDIKSGSVRNIGIKQCLNEKVNQRFNNYKKSYSKPEITKLK